MQVVKIHIKTKILRLRFQKEAENLVCWTFMALESAVIYSKLFKDTIVPPTLLELCI